MSVFLNKIRVFASGNPAVALFPGEWSRGKMREYLCRCLRSTAAGLSEDSRGLWDHQVETIQAIERRFADGDRRASGIVVVPTGGGKTEIFQHVVNATFRQTAEGRLVGPNTIVLEPTLGLVEQTARRFVAMYPRLSGVVGVVGSDFSENMAGMEGCRPITVTTYEGFCRLVLSGSLSPSDVHLLVMDEAHRALSEIRQDVFDPFIAGCATIAFSATPQFDETRSLYDLFGEGCEILNVPASRLRAEGIIAPVVNYVLAVKISGKMPEDAALAARIRRSALVIAVRDFWNSHVDENGERLGDKTMLGFFRDISHSKMACEALNGGRTGNDRFEVISGYDDPDDQVRKIAALRRGEIRGLLNTRFLGEGTDIPEVKAVVMAPTSSGLQAVQVGGRAVRFDSRWYRDDPRQTAVIVNTVIELNGKEIGSPAFYWEVLSDYGIARNVESSLMRIEDIPLLDEQDSWFEDLTDENLGFAAPSASEPPIELDRETPVEPETQGDETPGEDPEVSVLVSDVDASAGEATDENETDDGATGRPRGEKLLRDGELYQLRYSIRHRENMASGRSSVRVRREHPGWLDRYGMLKALGAEIDEDLAAIVFPALDEKALSKPEREVVSRAPAVRMKVVQSAGRTVVLYHEGSMPSLARRLDVAIEPMGDDWIGRKDIVVTKWTTSLTTSFLDRIDERFLERRRAGLDGTIVVTEAMFVDRRRKTGGVRFVEIPPVELHMDLRIGGNGRQICYRRGDLPTLRRILGLSPDAPVKTGEWLTRIEAQTAIGVRSVGTDRVFRTIEAMLIERELRGEEGDLYEIEGRTVRASRRATTRTTKPVCLHVDSVPVVRVLAGFDRAPPRSETDLSYKELARRLGTHPTANADLRAIRDEVEASFAASGEAYVDGRRIDVALRFSGVRNVLYWDASSVSVVRDALARRRNGRP